MFLSETAASGPTFFNLVPLVVFIPVIGLLFNIIFGKWLGEKAIGWIASIAAGLTFLVAVILGVSLLNHPEEVIVPLVDWISIGELQIEWAFQVDTLSVTMMLVVAGVGTLIHIYSIGYMHDDVRFQGDPGRYRRFFVYMNLFIAAMMVLVSADSYLMLFVGWEGVGLCSYLLIGFWFEKGKDGIGNALAAKKAFITNRVGDFGMLIAIFIMFGAFGSLNFGEVFAQSAQVSESVILAITLLMLVGVAGKSAQIPLYVWLPDAMAGPTPVSALIHAATMVTAGVYLITRSFPLYETVQQAQDIVALVGGITALFAATIAVGQFDIKKVLAYSTISQLGFMVAAVGIGAYAAGMFHLVTHAFFKALLFLSAGSVILGIEHGHHHLEHNSKGKKGGTEFDPQDMRNMGGLRTRMKTTFWVYLIGSLALVGIFPFAGFWSKDEILLEEQMLFPPAYWILIFAAFLTAFYMGRQVLMVFFGKSRSEATEHAKENPALITVPLIVLAFFSAVGGTLNLPRLHSFAEWLEHTVTTIHPVEFNIVTAIVATLVAAFGLFLSWAVYSWRYKQLQDLPPAKRPDDPLRQWLGPIFTGMENKWWVDELYSAIILNPYVRISHFLAETVDWRFWHDWFHDSVIARGFKVSARFLAGAFDLGFIDGIANGIARVTVRIAGSLRKIQTGYVRNYALSVLLGVVVIIGYLILR
ncbi:MAG: NADH-quinone oxidoreductase subunit L [Chloroflexota bacterium]|nr:MAG: NADH-quinone oxidoreductase subunit L [Chloroflexota bacterium]